MITSKSKIILIISFLNLQFRELDLKSNDDCNDDYLEVWNIRAKDDDGEDVTSQRLCGGDAFPKEVGFQGFLPPGSHGNRRVSARTRMGWSLHHCLVWYCMKIKQRQKERRKISPIIKGYNKSVLYHFGSTYFQRLSTYCKKQWLDLHSIFRQFMHAVTLEFNHKYNLVLGNNNHLEIHTCVLSVHSFCQCLSQNNLIMRRFNVCY